MLNQKISLLAVDLDDTLLNSKLSVIDYDVQMLKKLQENKNVNIIFASGIFILFVICFLGRKWEDVLKVFNLTGLSHENYKIMKYIYFLL
jgi:hydroxymethylpyrimidine pyrophosphatase-like HAD family hydrolase